MCKTAPSGSRSLFCEGIRGGSEVALLWGFGGTTIDLPGGFINTSIPIFGSTSSAFSSGLSVGNIYRDTTGNLKILIP